MYVGSFVSPLITKVSSVISHCQSLRYGSRDVHDEIGNTWIKRMGIKTDVKKTEHLRTNNL